MSRAHSIRWLTAIALAGCAQETPQSPQATKSAAVESPPTETPSSMVAPLADRDVALAQTLIKDKSAIVLDVRSQEEWDEAHYDGALLIPHANLEARIQEVRDATGGDKNRPIVVYCRSGGRAGLAREVLEQDGFTQVTNVGGLVDLCPDCIKPTSP